MSYERKNIAQAHGYIPGEQPVDARVVKLNTNENPYPPCPGVAQALRSFPYESLRRYPAPTASGFCRQAAATHGVAMENIVAVNGGDELLRLAVTTFVEPGQPVGTVEPGYSLYPVLAELHATPVFSITRGADWAVPADLSERMNSAGVKLLFLVNPNAPTGTLTPVEELAKIAATFKGVLVIDEAYVDFVDPELKHDAVDLIRRFENVLLLRTMSKGYSLAGLRFGYGIASASLIGPMLKSKDSYNTDAISQALATAALAHRDQASESWRAVRAERARLGAELTKLGLRVWPSQTNFLLAGLKPSQGGGAGRVYESLKERHIFVRYFELEGLTDKLRITIGTPEQDDQLLSALKDLL